MKSKRFFSIMLSVLIIFTMVVQPAVATSIYENPEEEVSIVEAVGYQSVATEIAAAQEITVVPQETGNIYYYWGINSFVVKDNSGYYFVEFNKDFTQFEVNGKSFDITKNENRSSALATTFPTAWSTMFDTNNSFDVGGLPHSVVGGIIGGAIGSLIPGPKLSIAVGTVIGSLAGMFTGGVFPIDYKITVMFYKKVRVLEPGTPTIMEFYERIAIYGGPSNNLRDTELYYDARTYTEEYWE